MLYNRSWVQTQYKQNPALKYLFFWGHRPSKNGEITKSCFSQWWLSTFEADGVRYSSAEQWMMACKATLFGDQEMLNAILNTQDPAQVKKLGRKVKNFDAAQWDEHKYAFVKEGNFYKFSQNASLKQFLLSTGNAVIVEASPYDAVWGIGLDAQAPGIEDPATWNGENLLGFALMEVRDELLAK